MTPPTHLCLAVVVLCFCLCFQAGAGAGAGSPTRPLDQLLTDPDTRTCLTGVVWSIEDDDGCRCPDKPDKLFKTHVERRHCHFTCVPAQKCGSLDKEDMIADEDLGECRTCNVYACKKCSKSSYNKANSGLQDHCIECAGEYTLKDGTCAQFWAWNLVWAVLLILALALPVWYVGLLMRPVINEEIRDKAVAHRTFLLFRDHTRDGAYLYPLVPLRHLWDGYPIGGSVMRLHFHFQYMVLWWVAIAGALWVVVAWRTDWSLLSYGAFMDTANVGSYQWCMKSHASRHKYDVQLRAKTVYVQMLYVFTCMWSLYMAFRHAKMFAEMESRILRMNDFALCLEGFPAESGEAVESERLEFVAAELGVRPVGVSVCWNYTELQQEVDEAVENELDFWMRCLEGPALSAPSGTPQQAGSTRLHEFLLRGSLMCDDLVMGGKLRGGNKDAVRVEPGKQSRNEPEEVKALLDTINSTSFMYVVFHSVGDCRRAHQHFARRLRGDGTGPRFKDHPIMSAEGLSCKQSQPDNVLWKQFGFSKPARLYLILRGVCMIAGVILMWGVCAYAPYGWYISSSYKTLGRSPGFMHELVFALIVVGGNQLVYLTCEHVSKNIGCRIEGAEQRAYVAMYTAAVLTNLAVDLVICFVVQRAILQSTGSTSDTGSEVGKLSPTKLLRESFFLRSGLGHSMFLYNFPSSFLLPFLGEVLSVVLIPLHLGEKICGTRPVSQTEANGCLSPVPMDVGRYADLVLNLIQSVIALSFVSGYVLWTFIGLVIGHGYIYFWDHYKVLRHMMGNELATDEPDKMTMRLLVIPCCVLLFIAVFLVSEPEHAFTNCFTAVVAHGICHLLLLGCVVSCCSPGTEQIQSEDDEEYAEHAVEACANWFNTNAVHTLRSRYIHEHYPPCIFYKKGKEFLQQANEEIGMFYVGNHFVFNMLSRSATRGSSLLHSQKLATREAEMAEMPSQDGLF